jgi:hypothetical protein
MQINRILIIVSFAWLLVSFWNRNELPGRIDYVPELQREPLQTPVDKGPFDGAFNGVRYTIAPE